MTTEISESTLAAGNEDEQRSVCCISNDPGNSFNILVSNHSFRSLLRPYR